MPADNAVLFINFIAENFDCYWLTTDCKGNEETALKYLSIFYNKDILDKLRKIKPANWETLKTEAINFTSDFYWLEDFPIQSEIKILTNHNALEKLIVVNLNNLNELTRVVEILKVAISKKILQKK
ncbi:MAG: hypothetical protein LH629_09320 [Ignavibacteria bacterium]|nr:hypothetical protein [Ignavibacteria bacterium]